MKFYRIYVIPNQDLSGTCIGVIYDTDDFFRVVACRKGPNYKYDLDQNITTIEYDDDFRNTFPDESGPIKTTKRIKIKSKDNDPASRIIGKRAEINFDTTREKFLKYFNLKEE